MEDADEPIVRKNEACVDSNLCRQFTEIECNDHNESSDKYHPELLDSVAN